MSDPQRGQIATVTRQTDGGAVYTHGHRFPDNVQIVEQRHAADGTLQSARVTWTGFAGQVLDVTATFDAAGNLVKEEGHRAPDMTTPVVELVKPLPATARTSDPPITAAPTVTETRTPAPASTPATAPATETETLADRLHRIYPHAGDTDGSDT